MPGRRCLLCADVDDLLDGEVLLELTRMLLSDAVPSPSDAGDAYDDTARVELALEALAGRGGLDLGGFKSDADVLVAVSGAAARWAAGDCRVIAPILAFLKDALAARALAEDPTLRTPRATRRSSPSATSTRALEALGRVGDRNTESTNPAREAGSASFTSPTATTPTSPSATSPPPRARDDAPTRDGISSLARLASSDVDDAAGSDDAGSDDAGSLAGWVARAASPERVAVGGGDSRPNAVRFGSPRAGSPGASHAAYAPSPRESAQAWSSRASIFRLTPAQQDIVLWMLSLGVRLPGAEVAGRRATSMPKSTEILEEMAKGLLLCDLATRLEGVHVGDVCARPKVTQEAMHNANRALDVFRRARRCRSDHMWSAREIAVGDAATCWGLLGDLRAAYGDARKRRSVGRNIRVPPALDARSAGRGSPVDAGGGETAAGRAASREASPTKPSKPSGSDDWRRGGAARTLAERGYPSPLAKAAAAVSASRASRARRERDARWTAAATRREERDGSPTSFAASPRRSSRTGRERARDASPGRARSRPRTLDPEGGPGSRYSRGGAIRSPSRIRRSSEGKGKPRAASATTRERPGYDPSGYVSPNEGGRRRATSARRFRDFSPPAWPRSFAKTNATSARSRSARSRTATGTTPSRRDLDALASRAARAAARAGNVPVVFEYNEGPPPPMPPASRRDEEVREWLRSLRLGVLPREEASELLSNPLRNGVLLSDLMTTLVGAPPLRRRDRDPRSLAVARANVERALVPLRTIPGAIPPALTWSTEGMLKGMRENIFGLLWYVKRAVPEQKRYARAAVPWEDPAAGPGVARVGKPGSHVLGGGLAYASTPRMSLPGTPRSPLVGAPSNVAETLAVAAAASDVSALNVADAIVTGTPAECAELGANRCSESYQFVPLPVARNARNASSRNSSPSAAPGIATRIERGVATSGYEALAAYGDEGIRRLESSVVRWLHAMGLLSDDALAGSFATLCPELSKGTLLCDLVAAIEGIPVVGVFRPPKSVATARANVRRACERLARHRGMCRRHLFDHDEIAAGSPGAVLALLEDVRVFYDGHPPRTSAKHWNENVPYCPEMGMGRPPPGRDANPPPSSPGRVLDPMRAMERGDDEDRDEDPDDDVNLDDEDAFGSDSEPPRGSRDRSRDRSNDRDPSLVGSPPGIRDGAHPHPRSPPSDPTATPPPSGAPVRLGASVGSFARPSGPSRPSLVASSPVKAARDAAAALEGWRASVVATVDRATDGSYHPTVSTRPTRVGEVVRAGAWEASSFPRTRAGAAEVEKSRAERSAAAAAAAVVRKGRKAVKESMRVRRR